MNIIIPMAGMGKRMRPHTLTIPKPLVPIAGKPIVEHLVKDIVRLADNKVDNIGFIISPKFGAEIEKNLLKIADNLGAKGHIFYQEEALGTAHAILCAKDILEGPVIVAFADTLIKAEFKIEEGKDGIIFVQKVEDPRPYGVVKLREDGSITDFVEKPQEFISDQAIIGIYYLKDGSYLKNELQYLIDNDIKDKGEYQITNALENMNKKGTKLYPGAVTEWLDCGNKNAAVYSNNRYLRVLAERNEPLISNSVKKENAIIIEPCFIGENVSISNSIVGPHVSIGENSSVENSILKDVVVQKNTSISSVVLENSMVGNDAKVEGKPKDLSIGDFNVITD